jgi:hypothetical protein
MISYLVELVQETNVGVLPATMYVLIIYLKSKEMITG